MAQMVCGSCCQLLSYPQRAQQAKCSCCETIKFVPEASFLIFRCSMSNISLLSAKSLFFLQIIDTTMNHRF
ncbi:hypothetical protein GQ457_07G029000 [Hibiscus cannabinus]